MVTRSIGEGRLLRSNGIIHMSIDRDQSIRFHEQGTLVAVTRWITDHHDGISEWLKNARSAYQIGRGNVEQKHQTAVLLLKDRDHLGPARIGLLDVAGATLEDVTLWSTWQDPNASRRNELNLDEGNQGNGGKAYMFRLFGGPARIIGVRDGTRNCKGFEGPAESVERGTPGFMPSAAEGREVPVTSWQDQLGDELRAYGIRFNELPAEIQAAVKERKAFTLVEGVDPQNLYLGRIDADDLIRKILRHDQSALAVQQLRLYAIHNGRVQNGGKALSLEVIAPYPGLGTPRIHEIPEKLSVESGQTVSTTESGTRSRGRLILLTSRDDMLCAYKNLKPRWKISYMAETQMIGSKPVSELVPATPGSYFIYGSVELPALAPGYVEHGRRRPKEGPLVEALDAFIADKIRELAREISDKRRHELDEKALDEVHFENRQLDQFKNKFLPQQGGEGAGGNGGEGPNGPHSPVPPSAGPDFGQEPEAIELDFEGILRVARDVKVNLDELLGLRAKDGSGRIVPHAKFTWHSQDADVVTISDAGVLEARRKGETRIWVSVEGRDIESVRVPVQVWVADHVLLTPRTLEIPLSTRKQVIAEVTNDEGYRATDVFLEWKHDADDQLIVRVRPNGWITGNRIGRTSVMAGAGATASGGVWSRIAVDVTVVPNPDKAKRGGGFPRLLLTGRDIDPSTGQTRQGDPDSPALWQEVSDFQQNIWWLNLDSPEAAFAFNQRAENPRLWRHFHVTKLIEMVVHVHMQEQFTSRGDSEQRDFWANHKLAVESHQVTLTLQMWDKLQAYVGGGSLLD